MPAPSAIAPTSHQRAGVMSCPLPPQRSKSSADGEILNCRVAGGLITEAVRSDDDFCYSGRQGTVATIPQRQQFDGEGRINE